MQACLVGAIGRGKGGVRTYASLRDPWLGCSMLDGGGQRAEIAHSAMERETLREEESKSAVPVG